MNRHIHVANSTRTQAAFTAFPIPFKDGVGNSNKFDGGNSTFSLVRQGDICSFRSTKRQSLWNTKSESYKNRNIKKKDYHEVVEIVKEDLPAIDLAAVKGW